jgi:hypothetical protein
MVITLSKALRLGVLLEFGKSLRLPPLGNHLILVRPAECNQLGRLYLTQQRFKSFREYKQQLQNVIFFEIRPQQLKRHFHRLF